MTTTGRETQTSAAFPHSFVTVGTEAKTRAQMDSTGAGAQGSPRQTDSVGAGVEVTAQSPHVTQSSYDMNSVNK